MIITSPLVSSRLLLKTLSSSHASDSYLSWLNDKEVNQYLESRFTRVDKKINLIEFIENLNQSQDNLLLGIFLKESGRHIGNIKLGPINEHHNRSEIGFLIGDKLSWGKGYMTEAIVTISKYAIDVLGLDKVTAGCYENNVGSSKALLNAGFALEGRISSHIIVDGKREASLLYGLNK